MDQVNSNGLLSSSNMAVVAAAAAAAAAAAVAAASASSSMQQQHSPSSVVHSSPQPLHLQSPNNVYNKLSASPRSEAGSPAAPTTGTAVSANNAKYECDKCSLWFQRYDLYKEHQLIHIMNPNLFHTSNTEGNRSSGSDFYGQNTPFGVLQQIRGSGSSSPTQQLVGRDLSVTGSGSCSAAKKRKYSLDEAGSSGSNKSDYESVGKKMKNEQFDFLYNYFMQNEPNDELKTKQPIDFDALHHYYEENEMKKKSGNLDFLYQYYLLNQEKAGGGDDDEDHDEPDNKPSFEFLFQYYQINESKKFFQLDASPQQQPPPPPLQVEGGAAAAAAAMTPAALTAEHLQHSVDHPFLMLGMAVTTGGATPKTPVRTNNLYAAAAAADQQHTPLGCGGSGSPATPPSMPSAELLNCFKQTMTTPSNTANELSAVEKQNNKRLRTTILPEQLNFLYECYQNESNPSRKMLEEISKKVNLKKRVVQVSFYTTFQ